MGFYDDYDNEAYVTTNRRFKKVIIAMNVILGILGLLLVILGGVTLTKLKGVSKVLDISLPSGLIVLGVFFMVLTIVGCYTSYRERLGGLAIYTVLMLILLICLVGVGVGIFQYRENVIDKLGDAWKKSSDGTRNATQDYFHCCGWTNHTLPGTNCLNGTGSLKDPTIKDCAQTLISLSKKYLYEAATTAVVIGIIEFVAVLISLVLVIRVCRNPRSARLLDDHEDNNNNIKDTSKNNPNVKHTPTSNYNNLKQKYSNRNNNYNNRNSSAEGSNRVFNNLGDNSSRGL